MNIGLIALSGIRVCDAELLRMGLTLPGFVERSKVIASLPSLGLLTLAALTPPPHAVRYLEVPDVHALKELPSGFDLVALSSYSAQIGEAYELARRYRAAGIRVVMGGPHVSAFPDEALEFCDTVVVGEGEPCWPEVVRDAAAGSLRRRYDSGPEPYDLAAAPVPAFELLDLAAYNRLTVQTARGCPHRCEFCASSVLFPGGYRQKPVGRVLAEIDRILQLWRHPFIEFADDNSFVSHAYGRELLANLRGRGLRWFTEADLSIADDAALLYLMRESGCAQALVGLESPVEAGLSGLDLVSDWKRRRFPRYREAVRAIQSHGITVNGCFVLGLDGHTPAIFDAVFDFVRETELYEVQITILTAFPGTPLYARLEREGRLLEPRNWAKCTLFDVNYRPSGMSPEDLRDGFKRLANRLYSDEFTQWRRNAFRKRQRAARGGIP